MDKKKMISGPSKNKKFRESWKRRGYELINITKLLETHMGESGWCNGFGEPDETIHHVQLRYRGETIANLGSDGVEIIDEEKHVAFTDENLEGDFIIYRKVEEEKR